MLDTIQNLYLSAPLLILGAFAVAVVARYAAKHDLDLWDMAIALAGLGFAAYLTTSIGPRNPLPIMQSGLAVLLSAAMALPLPELAKNWIDVAPGAQKARVHFRHAGTVLHSTNSHQSYADWALGVRAQRRYLIGCVIALPLIAAAARSAGWLIVVWVLIYGYNALRYSWSQFRRLRFMPRYSAPAPVADHSQKKAQQPGTRRVSGRRNLE